MKSRFVSMLVRGACCGMLVGGLALGVQGVTGCTEKETEPEVLDEKALKAEATAEAEKAITEENAEEKAAELEKALEADLSAEN